MECKIMDTWKKSIANKMEKNQEFESVAIKEERGNILQEIEKGDSSVPIHQIKEEPLETYEPLLNAGDNISEEEFDNCENDMIKIECNILSPKIENDPVSNSSSEDLNLAVSKIDANVDTKNTSPCSICSKKECQHTTQFITVSDFGEKIASPEMDPKGEFLAEVVKMGVELGSSSLLLKYFNKDHFTLKLGLHQLLCSFSEETERNKIRANTFLSFASSKMQISTCQEAFDKTKEQTGCSEWYDLRYGRITSSNIYEVSKCKTLAEVRKLVESIIEGQQTWDTPAKSHKRSLKKKVLSILEKQLNTNFQQCGIMLSPEYPPLGSSPFAVNDEFVVEIKCPSSEQALQDYITNDKYKAQIHLHMFLLNKKNGILCVADPSFQTNNRLNIIYVNYEQGFIEPLVHYSLAFWKKNIFPEIKLT